MGDYGEFLGCAYPESLGDKVPSLWVQSSSLDLTASPFHPKSGLVSTQMTLSLQLGLLSSTNAIYL